MILEHFDFVLEEVSISLTFPVATSLGDLEEPLIYHIFWALKKKSMLKRVRSEQK